VNEFKVVVVCDSGVSPKLNPKYLALAKRAHNELKSQGVPHVFLVQGEMSWAVGLFGEGVGVIGPVEAGEVFYRHDTFLFLPGGFDVSAHFFRFLELSTAQDVPKELFCVEIDRTGWTAVKGMIDQTIKEGYAFSAVYRFLHFGHLEAMTDAIVVVRDRAQQKTTS
jgi:hypothetical protein